ncbi:hypothetical protein EVG20_g3800 [Dentipellis fragilis]|uniref:Uncharacterized protein n=1 Tax=Dentipellis fragilis TaxID=205917 RepID=A0A4Y9YZP0_9AGAM|nr:hypothetical protein EVG20_g3800 [Dentipellis fragilis]
MHRHVKPAAPRSTFHYHPHLTARKCDSEGNYIPSTSPPPPRDNSEDWTPFADRPSFEFAELVFEKMETSAGDLDRLLKIYAAKTLLDGGGDRLFDNHDDLYATIDAIQHGDVPWKTFRVSYRGPVTADSPSWQTEPFVIHARDAYAVAKQMIGNPDFDGKWDYRPFEEYTGPENRRWCNLMSGQWAMSKADEIACDPQTHGAMFVAPVLGADKTVVSVQTGHSEFHPLYMSLGNIHGDVRRAHRDAVIPLAFLAIPKAPREHEDEEQFRRFCKQLYHTSIAKIMSPLKSAMTTPEVMRCPDGHFRRVIFQLGPFIADYPEQVYLAGIVSGWCPKCLARPSELDAIGEPRFRQHTEQLKNAYRDQPGHLWDTWGVVDDVTPFTDQFPRADIHEMITPDILHQLVKGTFKDHLVSWVEVYIYAHNEPKEAKAIMDDIDRRIAVVPGFPGLRRFPEGRNFKQWTGNDSKALMKVFLPAIVGYVPDQMVQCIAALLDFSYLARRSAHESSTLTAMTKALERFHATRVIFEMTGVRSDFALPRQHSLVHYVQNIQRFGSLNGLCSSITESKHIRAVKRPWRRSSKYKALDQMLRTNSRLLKLANARIEFGRRGMLKGDVLHYVSKQLGVDGLDEEDENEGDDAFDAIDIHGNADVVQSITELPRRQAYVSSLQSLARELGQPDLQDIIRRFLWDQLYHGDDIAGDQAPIDACPPFSGSIRVYRTATSTFYAPSELAGPGGMHREIIRSVASWYDGYQRRDTVLIQTGDDGDRMGGMLVGRIQVFLSFVHDDERYPCTLVDWLIPCGNRPDPVTGMWKVSPDGTRGLIHLSSVVRACHLIGVYGETRIPRDFRFAYALDSFDCFYLNRYTDYHAHETIAST